MYMLTKCINNEWHLKQTKKFTKKADVLLFSSHGRFDESFPASAFFPPLEISSRFCTTLSSQDQSTVAQ